MSYISENLMKDEQIVYETRLHWILFTRTVFWLVLTLFILFFAHSYSGPVDQYLSPHLPPLYKIAALITFCIALLNGITSYIKYISLELAVTNKRIVMKTGLVQRATLEILLHRIEGINIYQSMLGRILDYGTLFVSGIGGSKDPLINFPKPGQLRNLIQEQIEISAKK